MFSEPQPFADVIEALEDGQLHPVEFEHVATQPDDTLTGGGFYAPDVPLADQEAYYRVLHQDKYGVDPSIRTVRVSGTHTAGDLGDLVAAVETVESVPAMSGDGEDEETFASFELTSTTVPSEREDWWPDEGRVFASNSSVTFPLAPPCILLCPPPSLVLPTRSIVQEFEWNDQESIDLFTVGFAYEHDFKLRTTTTQAGRCLSAGATTSGRHA